VELRGRIYLKAGRDGPVRGGNPWIFSRAIGRVEPNGLASGDGVEVRDADGDALGFGYFNPQTTIAVRMLAFDLVVPPEKIVGHRLDQAITFRQKIVSPNTNCYRLTNGEGDGLPGIIVDRYGDALVVQILTAGAEQLRDELIDQLRNRLPTVTTIIERSAGAVRYQEDLSDRTGLLFGERVSEAIVEERGVRLMIDFERGQKTGGFLDQRENRYRLREIAQAARVLDAYCYSGGFALAALAGGARQVIALDSSAPALAWAQRNLELNGYREDRCVLVRADVLDYFRANRDQFDVVVIDPPPFARSIKDADRAGQLYVELNALAMRAVARGGSLLTFSCSAHLAGENFVRAVQIAQSRARRTFRIVERLGPAPDHPVLLGHQEGHYLTGLLLTGLG
jgi:23S rRNA (cytosine1962-C5)-methyltransferase